MTGFGFIDFDAGFLGLLCFCVFGFVGLRGLLYYCCATLIGFRLYYVDFLGLDLLICCGLVSTEISGLVVVTFDLQVCVGCVMFPMLFGLLVYTPRLQV